MEFNKEKLIKFLKHQSDFIKGKLSELDKLDKKNTEAKKRLYRYWEGKRNGLNEIKWYFDLKF